MNTVPEGGRLYVPCRECGVPMEWDRTMYRLCDLHVDDETIVRHYGIKRATKPDWGKRS